MIRASHVVPLPGVPGKFISLAPEEKEFPKVRKRKPARKTVKSRKEGQGVLQTTRGRSVVAFRCLRNDASKSVGS